MGEKVFMQGNAALSESAIRAGCKMFFGYPITPSSEMPEYYAAEAPKRDLVFVQAETEVAAFNMIAGAAAAGKRAMTGTAGPGFSLGQEAMSYMAAAGLPAVVVNVMRPGPADGEILGSQGDYFQAVKGGGHGDYNVICMTPYSVQEQADMIQEAFDLAEKYLNPVIVLTDATLAKMRESVVLPDEVTPKDISFAGAVTGARNREHNVITTCGDGPAQWEAFNLRLQEKYSKIRENEQKWESIQVEDADIVIVAFGSVARVALDTIKIARENGLKVGMIRPQRVWPVPEKAFEGLDDKKFLVVELNAGQMVEDVKLSVKDKDQVEFYGRLGGFTPTPVELYEKIRELYVK